MQCELLHSSLKHPEVDTMASDCMRLLQKNFGMWSHQPEVSQNMLGLLQTLLANALHYGTDFFQVQCVTIAKAAIGPTTTRQITAQEKESLNVILKCIDCIRAKLIDPSIPPPLNFKFEELTPDTVSKIASRRKDAVLKAVQHISNFTT